MAQKKQKFIGRTPTKADMKQLDKNIARYERMGWDRQVKTSKAFKKEQIAKMKRTDNVSRISKLLAENKGKPAVMKRVAKKSIARRLVGKHLAKAIPGVGAAIIARDVVKGVSKATCSKRGGKWVSGKCKGAKKDTRKITSPQASDLKSKR